ncbi:acid protease [Pleomassaria siparia CBS 279.74]|uniref:Acid protease n=1 Tax=Pleomassaria siparia CBS 279.74 TaxID=1314801 RepID=A0A6G1JY50_9PLEO|nr:acid protease [Pleomassaria siparia CBS 279.74]
MRPRRHRPGQQCDCHAPGTFLAFCVLLVVSTLLLAPPARAYSPPSPSVQIIAPRSTNTTVLADPIVVAPDQNWEGIDGQWNTFSLRIGEPEQWVRVLASTASQQTWAIFKDPAACPDNTTDCYDSRGRTFSTTDSKTWKEIGFYQLWLEKNLKFSGNGKFGYETVGLGIPGEQGPTLVNTTVGTLVSKDFWLGHLGLNAKPTNFTAFTEPSPSYMTYLFQQNLIPSLSFGYTAGAQYRLATVLASLTLGGYDASRFIPNDFTFTFAPDNERDIVVGIVGMLGNGATDNNVQLLKRDSFDAYIDSTVSELWLPIEVCNAFEETFGLQYNNETSLYLVDDTIHNNLLAQNASITFSLGQQAATSDTVNITLPYAAFDLEARPPYKGLTNATRYFPIRRASNPKQYVLGRTFLQEAYLIVDWERQNFSISQCSWVFDQQENILPIYSPMYALSPYGTPRSPKHLSTGAIIGIAIGSGFVFALIACAVVAWFWRKRHRRQIGEMKAEIESKVIAAAAAKLASPMMVEETPISPIVDPGQGTIVFPKAELPANASPSNRPMSSDVKDSDQSSTLQLPSPAVEVENTEAQIYEMPGDMPVRQEAGGRQLSEKESMMARERIYNGVDPEGPRQVSPTVPEYSRRPPPILASDVTLVNRRGMPMLGLPVSPVTPLTPQSPRDGAHLEASDTFFQPPTRTPRDGRFLEADDTLLSPISPLESSADTSRRRFSYES